MEVNISVKGWTLTTAYPPVPQVDKGGRKELRWFLRVKPRGVVEDVLSGTEAGGLFFELVPDEAPRPAAGVAPDAPLIPAWPDVRPSNSWCIPRDRFLPHMNRVLTTLGLPSESRSAMFTSWLPSINQHKNIAYRILNKSQLDPSWQLDIIPRPQAVLRFVVLFRGIKDADLKEWNGQGLIEVEQGLDWRQTVGYSATLGDDKLFRVIEYGAMEVFE